MGSVHWLDALTPPLELHLQTLVQSVKPFVGRTVPSERGGNEQDPHGPISTAYQPSFGAAKQSDDNVQVTSFRVLSELRDPVSRILGLSVIGIVSLSLFGFWLSKHPLWETARRPTSTTFPAPSTLNPDAVSASPLADVIAAANRGDPVAENALGIKYAQGESGLPHDNAKAVELYRDSARQGYDKAETNLGDMFFYGRGGLAQSYVMALSWYLKAAQQGSPDAQYRLGYM